MARVYAVRHVRDGTERALKVLKVPHESIRRRLRTEGEAQMRLQHWNIVAVHGIVDVHGSPGLIMDWVEGSDLDERLAGRPIPLPEADRIARGILEAMSYAHTQGVIHRDLKPANILLANGREPRVTDFGLARLIDGPDTDMRATKSGVAMGTPCYMAPEQIRDAKSVDVRADVYSLGALLYELITGVRAYPGEDMLTVLTAVAKGDRQPVSMLAPRAPSRMHDAIDGALEVDPEQRIPDVATLLAVWTGERRWDRPAAVPSPPPPSKTSVWPWMLAVLPVPAVIALATVALGLAAVLGWVVSSGPPDGVRAPSPSPVPTHNEQGYLRPVRHEAGARPVPTRPSPALPADATPPVAPAPASGRLRVRGSYRSVRLLGGGREHDVDGAIPPGAYTLQATFHEGSVYELPLRVRAGQVVGVQCDPGFKECLLSSP